MTLLDAYALVAFIAEDPAADEVEALLRGARPGVVVINLAEAVDVCTRVHGLGPHAAHNALGPLLGDVLEVVVSTEVEAWRAAKPRSTYYDKGSSALSLADCLLMAHVADASRREGVDVHALPDTSGRHP